MDGGEPLPWLLVPALLSHPGDYKDPESGSLALRDSVPVGAHCVYREEKENPEETEPKGLLG